MKKINALFLMIVLSIVMVQCTKTGPVGPAGPAGATGPVNNANVQTVVLTNRTFPIGVTSFAIPAITQNIVDSGVVVGFVRNPGASTWYALPFNYGSSTISIYSIQLGAVGIYASFASTGPLDFKFNIIAGHQ